MKTPLTTYRAVGKEIGLVFLFKYDLKGHLKGFEIDEGELNEKQMSWLFAEANFPATEIFMKDIWMKLPKYKKVFTIEVSVSDLSFAAFWELWGLKVKKEGSEHAWNKLSEANKIKCFLALPKYQAHLNRTGQAKAHLVTWINQKRFNDEY